MLGDSLTAIANWYEMTNVNSIINRGIPDNTIFEILDRIEQIYWAELKVVFLMMGINDIIMFKNSDQIMVNYENIVSRLLANNINVVV